MSVATDIASEHCFYLGFGEHVIGRNGYASVFIQPCGVVVEPPCAILDFRSFTLVAFISFVTLVAFISFVTFFALDALGSLLTLYALYSLLALVALVTLIALVAFVTLIALVALNIGCSLDVCLRGLVPAALPSFLGYLHQQGQLLSCGYAASTLIFLGYLHQKL